MYEQVKKSKQNKSRAVANAVAQKKSNMKQGFGFVDNRPNTVAHKKLQSFSIAEPCIQGYFKIANKEISKPEDVDPKKITIGPRFSASHSQVVTMIKKMAASTNGYGRFSTYALLVREAIGLIQKEAASGLPAVEPTSIKTGSSTSYDPGAQKRREKMEKLRKLRRAASLEAARAKGEIPEFRDTTKMALMTSTGPSQQVYSVGHTGNFLLGGSTEHTYKELFSTFKNNSGLDDKAAAKWLITALTRKDGDADPYTKLAGGQREGEKIIVLILGPEFRRAAINPIAAIAALNKVVADGGDLFTVFRAHCLFVATEGEKGVADGGSRRSQFHRIKEVDAENEDFQQTGESEFDAIMVLASRNGIDTNDSEAVERFILSLGKTSSGALEAGFTLGKR